MYHRFGHVLIGCQHFYTYTVRIYIQQNIAFEGLYARIDVVLTLQTPICQ